MRLYCALKTGLSRAVKKSKILVNVLKILQGRKVDIDSCLPHLDSVPDFFLYINGHVYTFPTIIVLNDVVSRFQIVNLSLH